MDILGKKAIHSPQPGAWFEAVGQDYQLQVPSTEIRATHDCKANKHSVKLFILKLYFKNYERKYFSKLFIKYLPDV